MQFILDNLLASIVAGMVFLILAGVSVRSQLATVETVNHYGLKNQELNFIEMLKLDLHGVSAALSVNENPVDSSFKFMAFMSPTSTTETEITYQRTKVGDRDGVPLYQIKRMEDGYPAGRSMVTVTEWVIEARNHEGGSITDPENTGQIYVRFEAAAPWQEDETIKRTRWESTFRPPLLRTNVLL